MSGAPQPRMHGLTHTPGGSDPIPGSGCCPPDNPCPTHSESVIALGATSNLLGYWRLGDGPTTYVDSNPYLSACNATKVTDTTALTADVTGALAVDDDGAVQFNGGAPPSYPQGDYLAVSTAGSCGSRYQLNLSADFSVAFWMYAPDVGTSTNLGAVVGCEAFGVSTGFGWWFDFDHGFIATNTLKFTRRSDGGTPQECAAVLTLDAWHFIVGTYSTSAGMALYVDGALVDSDAGTFNTGAPPVAVRFGQLGSGSEPFNGSLDEVSIWGDALTADQVTTLYDSGLPCSSADAGKVITSDGDGATTWAYPTIGVDSQTTRYDTINIGHGLDATAGAGSSSTFAVDESELDHGLLGGLADDDHPQYTQKATLTTKGDMYAATAASTPARVAVGSNGQVLTADSTASTGVAWATPSSGDPATDTKVWMPLTTTVGGDDVLVFDASHQLIPTLTSL